VRSNEINQEFHSDSGIVLAEDHDRVRVLTLNRSGRRNAIDLELRVMLACAMGIAAFGERHQPAFRGR
jgi:enoyl-CoA hydratase/carnithine racemase